MPTRNRVTPKVNLAARIPPELARRIRMHAASEGITVQQIVHDALEEYLQRAKRGKSK